ncbi:MAG: flagellar biosynthesis protein FlgA [Deltaproteobacteria bacterium]|nr:flagellar biosynthesis protein FlgA [Deltaproteobacteria bacterium]
MRRFILLLAVVVALPLWTAETAQAARIKDVARVDGVRSNQLIGYGLVVGLDRTGDSQRSVFTIQSMSAMLSRVGIRMDPKQLVLRNIAAVMVTAKLPPFAQPGTPIDIVVSSIGDARSLVGGTLLMTALNGVDGQTYAMAQGPLQVGGFGAEGKSGSSVKSNHLNVGRIPGGATVERSVGIKLGDGQSITLLLDKPDFGTSRQVAQAVNAAAGALGGAANMAQSLDGARIVVEVPANARNNPAEFIARMEVLEVTPDAVARVIINGRTGTMVMGDKVRISPVAIAHGSLKIEVKERPQVVQPNPLTVADPAVQEQTDVNVTEQGGPIQIVPAGATLADVVGALNALGATPRDLVQIIQAIQASGALHAELEVL